MKEINHEVFGIIKYDYLWQGEKEVSFLGKNAVISLLIKGRENAEFEQLQIQAFNNFFDNSKKLLSEAEDAIFRYYQEVCIDYRERLEDSADKYAPIIPRKEELAKLVELTGIIFPRSLGKEIRRVGLLLNCTWEPEHGLAVKYIDEEIVEVGYQDIVL